jgi:hypothetical protein
MTTVNVQFTDSTKTAILSYFGAPQDPTVYANLGTTDTDSSMWATFYAAMGGAISGLPEPAAT